MCQLHIIWKLYEPNNAQPLPMNARATTSDIMQMFGSQALTCTHARVNTCIWELGMYIYYTCIGWYILSLCIQQSFQHNSHYNYMVYPLTHALKWFVTLFEPRPFVMDDTLFTINTLMTLFEAVPSTVKLWSLKHVVTFLLIQAQNLLPFL